MCTSGPLRGRGFLADFRAKHPGIAVTLKEGVPVTAGTTAKSLAVQGFPAYEEWTAAEGNGELHVLVGGRFMIKITAGTSDLSTMENTAARMALQKLATQH